MLPGLGPAAVPALLAALLGLEPAALRPLVPSVLAAVRALVALLPPVSTVQARFALLVSVLAVQASSVSVRLRSVAARERLVPLVPCALQPVLPVPGPARQAVSVRAQSPALSAQRPSWFSWVGRAVPQRSWAKLPAPLFAPLSARPPSPPSWWCGAGEFLPALRWRRRVPGQAALAAQQPQALLWRPHPRKRRRHVAALAAPSCALLFASSGWWPPSLPARVLARPLSLQ